jgi:hypothetical protein
MHSEGCREYCHCVGRYSHIGDLAVIHIIVRLGHFYYHAYDLEQAPDRPQRMLRVGPRRDTICAGPVRSSG